MSTWESLVAFATTLPETQESLWYGTPAVKVRGKGFLRLSTDADDGVVVMCSLEEKEAWRRKAPSRLRKTYGQ